MHTLLFCFMNNNNHNNVVQRCLVHGWGITEEEDEAGEDCTIYRSSHLRSSSLAWCQVGPCAA